MESQKEPMFGVLELLGHKRLAGRVSECEMFGVKMGRIDIPDAAGGYSTQFFGGASVYRLSPVTEEVARAVARSCIHTPVNPWEIPKQLPAKQESPWSDDVTPSEDGGHALPPVQRADGEHGTYTGEFSQDEDADLCDEPGCVKRATVACDANRCDRHHDEKCGSECSRPRF